jgi:Xaa-Pro aminopeptidase
LGAEGTKRFIPAKDLIEDYVDTRLPDELEHYRKLVQATVILAQRALSNEVITPGVTTTADLKWWFDQKIASLDAGAEPWFTTNTSILRFNPETGLVEKIANPSGSDSPDNRAYERGDLINIDCGISYLGFKSDIQRVAYILRADEDEVPDGLKVALKNAGTTVEAYRAARPGKTGREAAAAIEKELEGVNFKPSLGSHSIGYHGHALGPGIRDTSRKFNPQRENTSPLRLGSYMAVEGGAVTAVPEWNGQEVRISYENDAFLTESGYELFLPMQTKWFVIR